MKQIEVIKMQSLSDELGHYAAARFCAPLAFFMLLRATGYLPKRLMPDKFCLDLGGNALKTGAADWSRPALSRELRHRYNVPIVSWHLAGREANIEKMKQAGYIETAQEANFFLRHIFGKSVKEIVSSGYPVVVTMKPGFGTEENSNIHAVLISGWEGDKVTVFDPDARNDQHIFCEDHVLAYLFEDGAGSVVLPKHS